MKKIFTLSAILFLGHSLFAQFTAGNIVVSRVGDGTTGTGTTSTSPTLPVTLLEFNQSGFSGTSLNPTYSLAIPSSGATNTRITVSGQRNGGTDGTIALSLDGRYIMLGGMDTDPVSNGNPSAPAVPYKKNFLRVNNNGIVEFSKTFTDGSEPGLLRGIVSINGESAYLCGATRVVYSIFNSGTGVTASSSSLRHLNLYGGQFYAAGGSVLNTLGNGIPTSSSILTALPGTNGALGGPLANPNGTTATSLYSFQLFDTDPAINNPENGADVMYIGDLNVPTAMQGGTSQGILKLAYNQATNNWDKVGSLPGITGPIMGILGKIDGTKIQFYAIQGFGENNALISFADDATRTTLPATITPDILTTASTRYTFRNIVFAPTAGESVAPAAPTGATATQASATTMTVAWTGITKPDDFANYTVVRYAVTPDGTDNPMQKNNYNVGTTIPGTNTGTIAYRGPLTSFTDAGLSTGTTYTYRVYAFDNSFNYSTAAETGATTLPIDLISFSGKAITNGALLSWSTASETNNQKFEVSSSTDGKNYTYLGSVAGAGNSTAQKSYTFLDKKPAKGNNYYRLKQVDFDGKSEQFDAVVNYNLDTKSALSIYPNPAQDQITVSFEAVNQSRNLTIYALDGKAVLKSLIEPGANQVNLNVSELIKGQYIVEIVGYGEKQVSKFIK